MQSSLSVREKIGYSVGEFGGSGLWQIMLIFLPAFYTDVFGIPAAAVGTMLLIVRVIDAGTDPVMGLIADRTCTSWGRFRPYLRWSAVPFGLLAFLLFAAPSLGDTGRLVYAYLTYTVMMLAYTMAMIPYSALSGVMTDDYNERASLNSFRFVGAFLAALIVQGLVQVSVSKLGGGSAVIGYRWTMVVFGILAVVGFWISFATTRERVQPVAEENHGIIRDLIDLCRNMPWVIILILALFAQVYGSIRSAAIVYYFKYAVGDERLAAGYLVAGTAATIVGISLTGFVTRVLDKKWLYFVGMAVGSLCFGAVMWVKPEEIWLLFTLQVVGSLVSGPTVPILWSMMGDAADYSEWRTNRRATGLVFSASTIANKAGGALGGALSMYVLANTGYQPNVPQTPEVIRGLGQMIGLYPALGAAGCAVLLCFYKLDRKQMLGIGKDLAERRASASHAGE